jgi:hypothetical protein
MKSRTRAHLRKPDYVAADARFVVIGETKLPKEPPTNGSWCSNFADTILSTPLPSACFGRFHLAQRLL